MRKIFPALILLLTCCSGPTPDPGDQAIVTKAREHYTAHQIEMVALVNYFNQNCPQNKMSFGIMSDSTITISYEKNGQYIGQECAFKSSAMGQVLADLGWTVGFVDSLEAQLTRVNCDRIDNGNPTTLFSRQSDTCIINYKFYKQKLSKAELDKQRERNEKEILNDSTIIYCDCVMPQ